MTDIDVINWARDYIKHGGEYTDEQFDQFVEASEQLSAEYPTNGDYTNPGSARMFDLMVAITYDTIFGDKTPAELEAEVKTSTGELPVVVAALVKQIRRVAGTAEGEGHAQRSIDELHRLQVAARERTDSLNQPTPGDTPTTSPQLPAELPDELASIIAEVTTSTAVEVEYDSDGYAVNHEITGGEWASMRRRYTDPTDRVHELWVDYRYGVEHVRVLTARLEEEARDVLNNDDYPFSARFDRCVKLASTTLALQSKMTELDGARTALRAWSGVPHC